MTAANPRKAPWSIAFPTMVGLLALVILVGGLGIWGTMTELAGAIVATGRVEVRSNRQIIQHPDGGVVGEILVCDGDKVEAGALLVQLDATFLTSELAIIQNQLYELEARSVRLTAERDDSDTLDGPPELLAAAAANPEVEKIVEGQKNLFTARRKTLDQERQMLGERIAQTSNQIDGTRAQLEALKTQTELIKAEITDQLTLKEKGLSRESQVKALQREESRLQGEIGRLESEAARLANQATETDVEILRLGANRRQEAITELRDLAARKAELQERALSLKERLSRLDIRAPTSGVVYDNKIFAIGSVIRAADPIMYIIPQDDQLIIDVNVPSIHIDQVYSGQPASLHFSAFSQRETPVVLGHVTSVSADVFNDERTGASYYRARVQPDPGELDRLGGQVLVPGMPVEAFIKTEDRTPLSYLTKPLTDYFVRAFRE